VTGITPFTLQRSQADEGNDAVESGTEPPTERELVLSRPVKW
jgi:hypothetical protein